MAMASRFRITVKKNPKHLHGFPLPPRVTDTSHIGEKNKAGREEEHETTQHLGQPVCVRASPSSPPAAGPGGPASGPVPYFGQRLAQQLYLTPGVNKPGPPDGARQLPGTAAPEPPPAAGAGPASPGPG